MRKQLPPLADERRQLVKSRIVTVTWPDGKVEKFPAIRGFDDSRVRAGHAGGAKLKIHTKLGEPLDD